MHSAAGHCLGLCDTAEKLKEEAVITMDTIFCIGDLQSVQSRPRYCLSAEMLQVKLLPLPINCQCHLMNYNVLKSTRAVDRSMCTYAVGRPPHVLCDYTW